MNKRLAKQLAYAEERTIKFWCAVAETQTGLEPLLQTFQRATTDFETHKLTGGWRIYARESRKARRALEIPRKAALKQMARAAEMRYVSGSTEPHILVSPGGGNHMWCEACGTSCSPRSHVAPWVEADGLKYRSYSLDFVDAVVLHTRHSSESVASYAARAGLRATPLVYSWRNLRTAVLLEREIAK